VISEYRHTIEEFKKTAQHLKNFYPKKKITVFGQPIPFLLGHNKPHLDPNEKYILSFDRV
jgi:hypothetical protein